MTLYEEDIIAAIATPVGEGAISIIRVSGKEAISLVDEYFKSSVNLSNSEPNTIHFGKILNKKGEILDEVLVALYRSPKSYTGEDMVEIFCHGGWFVTNKILDLILKSGARLAEPGEFTKRAFLNGKIDLSQAEAVADLIHSHSELAYRSSISQLSGSISNIIHEISKKLIDLIGLIELELDFVEEKIVLKSNENIISEIRDIESSLNKLINSYDTGKFFREGVKLIISGQPNSGKSSLLNAFLKENRAIVTPIPGTTRDIIEENMTINGALFRIIDTAGIRHSEDLIELEGIKRAQEKIEEADLILYLIDVSKQDFTEDFLFIHKLNELGKKAILVFNKIDLGYSLDKSELIEKFTNYPHYPHIEISAKELIGIEALKELIFSQFFKKTFVDFQNSVFITNRRHQEAILDSLKSLSLAIQSAENGMSGEFITVDLKNALNSLEIITGKVTTDDILNNIFSKFCIGK